MNTRIGTANDRPSVLACETLTGQTLADILSRVPLEGYLIFREDREGQLDYLLAQASARGFRVSALRDRSAVRWAVISEPDGWSFAVGKQHLRELAAEFEEARP